MERPKRKNATVKHPPKPAKISKSGKRKNATIAKSYFPIQAIPIELLPNITKFLPIATVARLKATSKYFNSHIHLGYSAMYTDRILFKGIWKRKYSEVNILLKNSKCSTSAYYFYTPEEKVSPSTLYIALIHDEPKIVVGLKELDNSTESYASDSTLLVLSLIYGKKKMIEYLIPKVKIYDISKQASKVLMPTYSLIWTAIYCFFKNKIINSSYGSEEERSFQPLLMLNAFQKSYLKEAKKANEVKKNQFIFVDLTKDDDEKQLKKAEKLSYCKYLLSRFFNESSPQMNGFQEFVSQIIMNDDVELYEEILRITKFNQAAGFTWKSVFDPIIGRLASKTFRILETFIDEIDSVDYPSMLLGAIKFANFELFSYLLNRVTFDFNNIEYSFLIVEILEIYNHERKVKFLTRLCDLHVPLNQEILDIALVMISPAHNIYSIVNVLEIMLILIKLGANIECFDNYILKYAIILWIPKLIEFLSLVSSNPKNDDMSKIMSNFKIENPILHDNRAQRIQHVKEKIPENFKKKICELLKTQSYTDLKCLVLDHHPSLNVIDFEIFCGKSDLKISDLYQYVYVRSAITPAIMEAFRNIQPKYEDIPLILQAFRRCDKEGDALPTMIIEHAQKFNHLVKCITIKREFQFKYQQPNMARFYEPYMNSDATSIFHQYRNPNSIPEVEDPPSTIIENFVQSELNRAIDLQDDANLEEFWWYFFPDVDKDEYFGYGEDYESNEEDHYYGHEHDDYYNSEYESEEDYGGFYPILFGF